MQAGSCAALTHDSLYSIQGLSQLSPFLKVFNLSMAVHCSEDWSHLF